jgi:hypothetical protein
MTLVNEFNLTAGRHKIEIYSSTANLLELMWSVKSGSSPAPVPVPVDALEPDYKITEK